MQNKFIERPASNKSLSKRKPLYGIGINDADYITLTKVNGRMVSCPYYRKWKDMLRRCFCGKYHEKHSTYKECSVCQEWLLFSNFKAWMKDQEWEGLELDKDVISPGNKTYSPGMCAFISTPINRLLGDHALARGKLPQGVYFNTRAGKYPSRVNYNGTCKSLGYFTDANKASDAYIKAKVEIILEAATEQSDHRIANGLRLHADILLAGLSG